MPKAQNPVFLMPAIHCTSTLVLCRSRKSTVAPVPTQWTSGIVNTPLVDTTLNPLTPLDIVKMSFSMHCFSLSNWSIALYTCMHEVSLGRPPCLSRKASLPLVLDQARSRLMCACVPHASVCSAGISSRMLRSTTIFCSPICLAMLCGCF